MNRSQERAPAIGAAFTANPADQTCPDRDPLSLLAQGHLDLTDLAREAAGGDLHALGRWAMQSDTAQALAGLLRLTDARTQLAIGRYRMIAATMLARIISDPKAEFCELVRKACVDLLSIDPALAPKRSASAAARTDSNAASNGSLQLSEDAMLRTLESMGCTEHEPDASE